jgi:phage FluMu protein Com
MDNEHFVAREKLAGQKGDRLFPVRCQSPQCGVNKNTGMASGGQRLLGHYRAGTVGEVRCPRCGFVNKIKVEARKRNGKTAKPAEV